MSKLFELKFLKEVGILGISNLMNAASNGLIIIQLNKYLSPDQSGVFLYLLAIASPIFFFLDLI
jgi:O-antigen/teichoic acid export membrane protein